MEDLGIYCMCMHTSSCDPLPTFIYYVFPSLSHVCPVHIVSISTKEILTLVITGESQTLQMLE